MSFKTILFCLFLYVGLVWIGAAYVYSGPQVQQFGLFWTGVGLGSVLVVILLSRTVNWARIMRARRAAKPKPVLKPAVPVSLPGDETATLKLIEEAKAALSRAPDFSN